MNRRAPAAKIAKAIALRVEQQLSTPVIARRVRLSNATVYSVLKHYPWTGDRVHKNDWTVAEVNALIGLWPTASKRKIELAIPQRSFQAVGKKAVEIGLRRPTEAYRRDSSKAHPVIAKLEKIRRDRKIKRPALSKRTGIHVNQLCLWPLGRRMPKFDKVCAWAEAMGYEIVVQKK